MRAMFGFLIALFVAASAQAQINNPPNPITATGGSASRLLQDHFRDLSSLFDYGAVCDGSTDDTTALTNFNSAGGGFVPRPTTLPATTDYCKTTTPRTVFTGPFWALGSGGRIADSSGNLLGPIYGRITSAPTLLGTYSTNSVLTSFNYDTSKQPFAIEYNITGAATLGQPSTGYANNPQAAPVNGYLFSSSGFNNGTSGNDGRTGAQANYWAVANAGQGDMTAYFCSALVTGTKPGATSFLASSEVGCFGGQLFASADGQYMEAVGDINLSDNGHDVAAFSWVNNLKRTNSTGALNVNWVGMRQQVTGTKPIDAVFSATGPTGISIDLTGQTYPDQILANATLTAAGSGYVAGDFLTVAGGTFDTQTVLKVLTTTGSPGPIATFAVERAGKYSVLPASPNTPTGGTGSGATFTIPYQPGAAMTMPQNAYIYFNAVADSGAFGTAYPSTVKTGTTRLGYNSSLAALYEQVNNTITRQVSLSQTTLNTALQVGTATQLTLAAGEVGLAKVAASGSAPGASGLKFEAVCGTNAGTAKIIAYAGTSTTPVTITDNIGSGVTGC